MSMDFTGEPRVDARREEPEDVPFAPTPVFAQPTRKVRARTVRAEAPRQGSRIPLAAMVVIPAAVLAVGIAGYYATRPAEPDSAAVEPRRSLAATDAAIAQAQAEAAADSAAMAAAATSAAPQPVASVEPVPPPVARPERPTRIAQASRTRAPLRAERSNAASALDVGADASATVPAAPMPYSATVGGSDSPAPAAPSVTPAPLIVPPVAEPVNPAPSAPQAPSVTP